MTKATNPESKMNDLTIYRNPLGYFIVADRFSFATPNAAAEKARELLGAGDALASEVATLLADDFNLVSVDLCEDGFLDISATRAGADMVFISILK